MKLTYHYECGSRRVDLELEISLDEYRQLVDHQYASATGEAFGNFALEVARKLALEEAPDGR